MAKRRIFTGNAECLYKVCKPVDRFDRRLGILLDDMAETMYDAEGVGLAAPQVGILKRAVVIDCGDGIVELINPEILETSGEQGSFEGCLSFPGESGYVVRPNYVKVRAQNRDGDICEYEAEGLFARAVLHETDHLDGLVYKRLVTEPPEGYSEDEEEE
ncbi:MAG: peptide deformylase [Eubacteriales bacterium]|jgi:peptide deformylase|nr:peptide deformylase [Eubacteriales bacterium]MCI6979331.1 peptide deformylase [Clostridiales bacterium]MDD6721513.1 peptide deformylase [Clostridiales bacterium]MDY5693999.1 peptide deformylase [Eubacteriales bacterium]HZK44728.1 peptide deformylase [Clostridia bacterium]